MARRFGGRGLAMAAALAALCAAPRAQATVVRFNSVLGNILVRMYDQATPLTVANFTAYANANAWVDNFIHRSIPGFVIQGGGYNFPVNSVVNVPDNAQVMNEYGISNLRGTIAMAKLPPPPDGPPNGGPNSATNEWFFNLGDNSANLNNQNGGFTVFGRVVATGMTVVDAIAALPRVNAGSPFDTLPVRDYVSGNLTKANLVTFNNISVLNVPAGDYNFDGRVDGADLTIWRTDLGSTTKADADGNGNGVVDGADLLVWQRSLGQNFGAPFATAGVGAVPEPTAACLAAGGAASAWLAGRRRRQRNNSCSADGAASRLL